MVAAKAEAALPFLKWAGGKRKLADQILDLLPTGTMRLYVEPFAGGAAVFFRLRTLGYTGAAALCDSNPHLINAYEVIRDQTDRLVGALAHYNAQAVHLVGDADAARAFYNVVRESWGSSCGVVDAARMLWLNRNCFNGLFRMNRAGGFNTPWGKFAPPRVVDISNLRACSAALAETAIVEGDFRVTLPTLLTVYAADLPHTAVYLDPPYEPVSSTANFTTYDGRPFTQSDQEALLAEAQKLATAGATVVISNSDTPFTRELYTDHEIFSVEMARAINSDASKRGPVGELLVRIN